MKYIDADLLQKEINRKIELLTKAGLDWSKQGDKETLLYYSGKSVALNEFGNFIDSLQQEQPTNTGNLCSELTDFLVRNDVPEEKAKFLANRISDEYGSKKDLEGLCDGIKQEQQKVDLEKEIEEYWIATGWSKVITLGKFKVIARYFYGLGQLNSK